jgi:hypothetical protein
MLQLGILTLEQYERATKRRRSSGSGVAFTLLKTGDPPTKDDVQRFEEISYRLRTSNGTTRMTFRNRMPDVDELALQLIGRSYRADTELVVQDRAASTCLTSTEWAKGLFAVYLHMHFEASDMLLYLFRVSLPDGSAYVMEPSGQPLQYIKPPFAVCLCPREPLRYPLNHLVVVHAKRKFRALSMPEKLSNPSGHNRIEKISCVHPEALALQNKDPRFTVRIRSVFEHTPGIDILRTMNILNLAYFPTAQLMDGIRAAFGSVKPGGIWIVGRTHEWDSRNHVTFFKRTEKSWEVLERIGNGSEIEKLVMGNGSELENDCR